MQIGASSSESGYCCLLRIPFVLSIRRMAFERRYIIMCVPKLSSGSRVVVLNLFMRFHDTRLTCINNNKEAFVIDLRLVGNRLETNHFPADVHTHDKNRWEKARARNTQNPNKLRTRTRIRRDKMGLVNYEISALLWAHWGLYWNSKPDINSETRHTFTNTESQTNFGIWYRRWRWRNWLRFQWPSAISMDENGIAWTTDFTQMHTHTQTGPFRLASNSPRSLCARFRYTYTISADVLYLR